FRGAEGPGRRDTGAVEPVEDVLPDPVGGGDRADEREIDGAGPEEAEFEPPRQETRLAETSGGAQQDEGDAVERSTCERLLELQVGDGADRAAGCCASRAHLAPSRRRIPAPGPTEGAGRTVPGRHRRD